MKNKTAYLAPMCEELEYELEGMIAQSIPDPNYVPPFTDEEEW